MIYRNDDPCALSYRDSYIMSDDDYDGYFGEEDDEEEDDEELFICSHCGASITDSENCGYGDVPLCDECADRLEYLTEAITSIFELYDNCLEFNMNAEDEEKCQKWLIEYITANQMSLKDAIWFCWTEANWIYEQVFKRCS